MTLLYPEPLNPSKSLSSDPTHHSRLASGPHYLRQSRTIYSIYLNIFALARRRVDCGLRRDVNLVSTSCGSLCSPQEWPQLTLMSGQPLFWLVFCMSDSRPARPTQRRPICCTHLPNSVNVVKARLLPDMGLLSKPRTCSPRALFSLPSDT